MKRERRLNLTKSVKIKKFVEIVNDSNKYETDTIRFIVTKIDNNKYSLRFDNKTTFMIYDMKDKNFTSYVDDNYIHYIIIETTDLSKSVEKMLKESHVKHGLE